MKKILIVSCIAFLSVNINAQSFKEEATDPGLETRAVLKFAPLSLFDFYSAIQFALEYRVGRTSAMQVEGGYVMPLLNAGEADYSDFEHMKGYRLRSEYRYYFKLNANRSGGVYFAPELFFLHVDFERTSVAGINISGLAGFDYYQEATYDVDKDVFGYHAKMGYQKRISDFIFLDFYGGIGARHIFIDSNKPGIEGENEVLYKERLFYDLYDKGEFYRLSASLGLKIGFLLK